MFKLTKLISLRPDTSVADQQGFESALRVAGQDGRVRRSLLQRTLKGSMHAGGFIWHLQFDSEDDYRAVTGGKTWREGVEQILAADPVFAVDSAAYRPGRGAVPEPAMTKGVYRTLFVAVRPVTPADKIRQFEDEMCEMPRFITAIRNWSFSRVIEASGARGWSHVWEQDFQDTSGLQGPYMLHPHHWAFIDRWYNHECPDWIIDNCLRHTFCAFDNSVFVQP